MNNLRLIKFRGKRIDNDEWLADMYTLIQDADGTWLQDANECQRIDPDTLGQFTGLLDKNGKEIYEGDIITVNGKYPKLVKFIDEWASFCLANVVDLDEDMDTGYWHQVSPGWWTSSKREIKIIGNVFDNPELLKGGEE